MIPAALIATLAGARLLIVDDNRAIGTLLATAFRAAGCEVGIAADRAGALELVSRQRWSLAVLDIDLPDGNGVELLGQLRARLQAPQLPAVFITGRPSVQRQRQIAALGSALLVSKPFGLVDLVAIAAVLLEGPRAAS